MDNILTDQPDLKKWSGQNLINLTGGAAPVP